MCVQVVTSTKYSLNISLTQQFIPFLFISVLNEKKTTVVKYNKLFLCLAFKDQENLRGEKQQK